MLTNKPSAFGQAREQWALKCLAQRVLIVTAVGAGRTVLGLQVLQHMFAGTEPPVGRAGAARSFQHPCALHEVGRKHDRELPV